MFRALGACGLLLVLSGCYASTTPLLSPSEAAYPFGAQVDYIHFDTAEVQTQGKLQREGDVYVRSEQGRDVDSHILFQHLRDEFYLVQESNAEGGGSNYDLVRIRPDIVFIYNLRCGEVTDAPAITAGAVTAAPESFGGLTCTATSLDTIREVIESKIAGAIPKEEFRILGVGP